MICFAFLKRDILHAGTFREDESIGLSLRRDFGFVIMQTMTWEKKVVIVVYICHVSLLENHDLRCCIEKSDILQTSTFREMCRELGFVTQRLELIFVAIVLFFSLVL